jgi:hypothetical protein
MEDLLHTKEIDALLAELTETTRQAKALAVELRALVPVLHDLLVIANAVAVDVKAITGRLAGR